MDGILSQHFECIYKKKQLINPIKIELVLYAYLCVINTPSVLGDYYLNFLGPLRNSGRVSLGATLFLSFGPELGQ